MESSESETHSKQLKTILVAPLNWGIGHATRCVPIINALLKQGFTPIIASDGVALTYLQTEFPKLKFYTLPAYKITYPKHGKFLKIKLFFQTPKVLKAIRKEKKVVEKIIEKEKCIGIISDNRFGVYSRKIPSVYITHQVNVLSGFTTVLTSKMHQKIMQKFTACWVPDTLTKPHLAGTLSKLPTQSKTPFNYIGLLSRFNQPETPVNPKYDVLVLLSGIEPQRSLLENKLIKAFENDSRKLLFVRGLINESVPMENTKNCQFINFLSQTDLEKAINQSELVVARSGYSTIMDLAVLHKKAFFIPTPGQEEQIYLAKNLQDIGVAPYANQGQFRLEDLQKIKKYSGFNTDFNSTTRFVFDVFNV